jgi:hypothetical protein
MNEQEIAKKIVSYLDEIPLEASIEKRLAQARQVAMSKAKAKHFVEVEAGSVAVMKSKWSMNSNNWVMWALLGATMLFALQNPIREQIYPKTEDVTLASPALEEYLGALHERNQEFQKWDGEMDKLLKD